jgi:hypothetical protein
MVEALNLVIPGMAVSRPRDDGSRARGRSRASKVMPRLLALSIVGVLALAGCAPRDSGLSMCEAGLYLAASIQSASAAISEASESDRAALVADAKRSVSRARDTLASLLDEDDPGETVVALNEAADHLRLALASLDGATSPTSVEEQLDAARASLKTAARVIGLTCTTV